MRVLPGTSFQPAPADGVADAPPRSVPATSAFEEFTARTWKVCSVPLVRLPTVAEAVAAPLDATFVHEP